MHRVFFLPPFFMKMLLPDFEPGHHNNTKKVNLHIFFLISFYIFTNFQFNFYNFLLIFSNCHSFNIFLSILILKKFKKASLSIMTIITEGL